MQIIDEGGLAAEVLQQDEVLNADSVALVQSTLHVLGQFPVVLEDVRSRAGLSEDTPGVDCLRAANTRENELPLYVFRYVTGFRYSQHAISVFINLVGLA